MSKKATPYSVQLDLMRYFNYTLHQYLESKAIMRIALSVPTLDDMHLVQTYTWSAKTKHSKSRKVKRRVVPLWLAKEHKCEYEELELEA